MTGCGRMLLMGTLLVLAVARTGHAGELAGSVNVRNGIVYVEVDDDGKPAVGVKVRLQEVRKKEIVAKGNINAEGQWSWPLLKAGSYEVVIDPGQPGQDPLVLPVDQREQIDPADAKKCPHHSPPPEEAPFPWLPVGLGFGCVGGGGTVLWLCKCNRWNRRPAGWAGGTPAPPKTGAE